MGGKVGETNDGNADPTLINLIFIMMLCKTNNNAHN